MNRRSGASMQEEKPDPRKLRGVLFALAATIVWSFNFVAGRGLADAMPPCTLALCRWLVAFVAIFPFAVPGLVREWRHFCVHWRYYLVVGVLGIAWFNTAIYMGAHTVSAVNMSLIATSSPLFTLLLARIVFGDTLHRMSALGIVTALGGVLLLISRGDLSVLTSLSFHGGDLLLLSAAFSFSCYTLLVRKKPDGCGLLSYFAVTFGLGALVLLPFSLWELGQGAAIHFSPALIGGILYMGLGASLLAFWCWSRAISDIGPSKAAIIYYSLPLFSGLEAVLLLGEPLLWVHFAGGALILGGLVLATRQP
ncbi:DMT family transporter [Desulfosarcina sp. OttesenSCG-928-G10]|nr:DMT family transporter [Desulfosarcina sp. OttesenSCG-928-G10]MDL2321486.1 DMT family transporter [Desulfosarcina sp. OttesenSCG-928-B08]